MLAFQDNRLNLHAGNMNNAIKILLHRYCFEHLIVYFKSHKTVGHTMLAQSKLVQLSVRIKAEKKCHSGTLWDLLSTIYYLYFLFSVM